MDFEQCLRPLLYWLLHVICKCWTGARSPVPSSATQRHATWGAPTARRAIGRFSSSIPSCQRQQAESVKGVGTALGVEVVGGQLGGAEHVQPVPCTADAHPGLVGMGDRRAAQGLADCCDRCLQPLGRRAHHPVQSPRRAGRHFRNRGGRRCRSPSCGGVASTTSTTRAAALGCSGAADASRRWCRPRCFD